MMVIVYSAEEQPVMHVASIEKNTSSENQEIDLERNLTSDVSLVVTSENAKVNFPTRLDIFYDLNGSLAFVIGSSGFILSMYHTNWLPYFRYGCLVWIWGCVFYTIPLLLKFKSEYSKAKEMKICPWGIGDFGAFLCFLLYIIGCTLGGFFDEETVELYLPAINHMFVYGSFSLLLEPVYKLFVFLFKEKNSNGPDSSISNLKKGETSLPSSNDTSSESSTDKIDDNNKKEGMKFNWDCLFESGAILFYCGAALFGGFPPHPSAALPGVYFWEVGSLCSFARTLLMVQRRKQGLRSQCQAAS